MTSPYFEKKRTPWLFTDHGAKVFPSLYSEEEKKRLCTYYTLP
jgi:hypothetical protein